MREDIKNRIEAVRRREVPEGYHKDYCLMPIEWNSTELKNIAKKVSQKNRGGEDVAVLSNSAVRGVVLQREYFEKDIANNENTDGYFVVEPGDYIYNPRISVNAPFGPIKRNNLGHKGIVSPLYTVFRPKKGEFVDERYLEYFFLSTQWNRFVYTVSNQGVRFDRMNITDDDFFCMSIAVPPLAEQQKIAEILATCDRVIELKQQLLEEKRRQKQWLMQKLLDPENEGCLHGFNNKRCTVKLGDLCTITTGKLDANAAVENGQYPFFTCSRDTFWIDNYAFDGDAILIAGNGDVGHTKLYSGKFNAYQRTYVLMNFGDLDYRLVKQYIDFTLLPVVYTELQGGAMPYIKLSTLTQLSFSIPSSSKEQEAITNILLKADEEIDILERDLEAWQQKKKALMQLLLTGLVRVNA